MNEDSSNNKLINIASLVGIVSIFVILLLLALRSCNNTNNEFYDFIRPVTTEIETEIETEINTQTQEINCQTIEELLSVFCDDINNLLSCNNPNYLMLTTPGITLQDISGIRASLGQSAVETYFIWKADNQLSTAAVKGDYLISFNINTKTGLKKLYIYVWPIEVNSQYQAASISFEIGEL